MALVIIALHRWQAVRPRVELQLILLAGVLRAVLDSLPVALGLVQYPSGAVVEGMAPGWILSLSNRYDGMAETARQNSAHNGSARAGKPAWSRYRV